MTAVALPVAVPDVDWQLAVDLGRAMFETRDDTRWGLGRIVHGLVEASAPDKPEKSRERSKRVRGLIKQFGAAIKMPNSNTLAGYYKVYAFYPQGIQEDYKTLSWSHFRSAARKGMTLAEALPFLAEADGHDLPVGTLSRMITTHLTGTDADTVTMKRVYDGHIDSAGKVSADVFIGADECRALRELMSKPGFTCKLTVSWQEVA